MRPLGARDYNGRMSLGHQLNALETAELIRLVAVDPDLAYLFRHALVREAAYGSLVKADRRRLHLAAAEALEAMHTTAGQPVSAEVAALLAQHFHSAGEARALPYATQAGEAALTRYANTEAVAHFSLALEWALRGTASAPLARLYVARGRALELVGKFAEALENYEAQAAAGRARGDQRLELQGLVLQGKLRSTINPMFNPDEGRRLEAAALPLAQVLDDREAQAQIHWNALNLKRFTGHMRSARDSGEQSLALAREVGATEQETATLSDLIHIYGALGAWPEHRAAAAGAADRWRAMGNLPMLADSLSTTAYYAAMRGDFDRAVAASAEAGQIARSSNNLWGQSYCLTGATIAHWYRAEYAAGVAVSRECLRLAGLAGFLGAFTLNRSQLACLLMDLGQPEAALVEARAAFDFAEARLPAMRPMGVGTLALAQVGLGQFDEAAGTLDRMALATVEQILPMAGHLYRAHAELAVARHAPQAVQVAERRLAAMTAFQAPPLETEARLTLAKALRQVGALEAASAQLQAARPVAVALGLRRVLWPIMAELAGLADETGDTAAAEHWRAEAQGVVNHIAAALPEAEMRASFESRAAQVMRDSGPQPGQGETPKPVKKARAKAKGAAWSKRAGKRPA